jgi:hypothetical protein
MIDEELDTLPCVLQIPPVFDGIGRQAARQDFQIWVRGGGDANQAAHGRNQKSRVWHLNLLGTERVLLTAGSSLSPARDRVNGASALVVERP